MKYGKLDLTGLLSRKTQAMLIFLACNRKTYQRSQLAEMFWYERSEEQAASNLRTLLSRLRPHVEEYLLIKRDTVSFNHELPLSLDVIEFRQNLAKTRQLSILQPEVVSILEHTLNLYKGDFLTGFNLPEAFGFEELVIQEREELKRMLLEGLERLVTFYQQQKEYQSATGWIARLLEIDPLNEEAHRRKMLLLVLAGQRNAAMLEYRSYLRYLAQEHDISPEAETSALYEQIKNFKLDEKRGSLNLSQPPFSRNIDRIEQLKRVSIFAETPETVLSELAELLVEEIVEPGQIIFKKGDLGDCMYLILEGRVRVHDGDRILNELSQPDLFGEMALLDAAPRLASVTAITASTLWRLDQKTFYNLMSKQSEVATGIIKVLTKRLRERVSDVIELKTQLLKSTGDS